MKQRSMSLLASDLIGNVEFDVTQTLPALDIKSDEYNSGAGLYLRQFNLSKIDAEYNDAVRKAEFQLEEQELTARLQANAAAEATRNAAVETQVGLGTGAAAVADAGAQSQLNAMHDQISANVAESYANTMQSIGEQYQSDLESVLGKYDAQTQTFAGLAQYQQNAELSTEAVMKVMANMFGISTTDSGWSNKFVSAGYATSVDGSLELTDSGQQFLDYIVNGTETDAKIPALGDKTFFGAVAEEMARSSNPAFDQLSDAKRTELIDNYAQWLTTNQFSVRLSNWDLFNYDDGLLEIDITYTEPRLHGDGLLNDGIGINIMTATAEDLGGYTDFEILELRKQIASGEIPNGAYFSGSHWYTSQILYVQDGYVYITKYNRDNLPPKIQAKSAVPSSFGVIQTESEQEFVNKMINDARAGLIEEDTIYEIRPDKATDTYWQYKNNTFVQIDEIRPGMEIIRSDKGQNMAYAGSTATEKEYSIGTLYGETPRRDRVQTQSVFKG